MEFSGGLVLKILGGLSVVSAGSVGTYFLHEHLKNPITKFDKALIEFLDKDTNDIVFSIKQDSSPLSTNFPENFTNPLTIKVEVSATTSGEENLKGTDSAGKTLLQSLNGGSNGTGGTAWTWICEMNFTRDSGETISSLNDSEKQKILHNTNDGLFGKLKKDVTSDETNRASIKKIKKDFIKKCAEARTKEENKKIESEGLTSNQIITPKEKIEFKLKKGATDKPWGSDETKLFFEDKERFNYWFS